MEIEYTRKGSSFFVERAVVVRVRVCGVWLVGVGVFSVFFALPIFHSPPWLRFKATFEMKLAP